MHKKWREAGQRWSGWRWTGLGALALLAACGGPQTPPVPPAEPCALWGSSNMTDLLRQCGVAEVPLRYAEAGGPKLGLNYVVLSGESGQKSRDVTVVIQGGPGMSVEPLVFDVASLFRQLRPQSDLLLFEQRGVGSNTPNLNCPVEPALASVQPSVFKMQAEACLAQYKGQGLNLADFNTRANADDIASLVKSLGYEQANLYGMSYGSRVAQEVVRRHPALVRSVILDGVLDPAESWASAQTKYVVQTLSRFGQACAAAGQCKEADLPARIQRDADLIDHLGLTFQTPSPEGLTRIPLTGDMLLSQVHNMAYSAWRMLELSPLLDDIEKRDLGTLQRIPWDAQSLWSGLNMGAFFAFACQDNAIDAASIEAAHAGLLPVFKRRGDLYKNLAGMCAEAGLTPAPDALTPISGNVPMLLISGRYDAITPPELAERVAARFPNSKHVIFEDGGHVNGIMSDCGALAMLYFLNTLTVPDTSCAANRSVFGP